MTTQEIQKGFSFPQAFWRNEWQQLFPQELVSLLIELHREFEPERQRLLNERKSRQARYDQGEVPQFLDRQSEAVIGDWKVAPLPSELQCRRVEITGPVNSAKMVINMLNRNEAGARADMAMLDFEDSMKPSFPNVLQGYKNVIAAVGGQLTFAAPAEGTKPAKTYRLNPEDSAYVMVRVRGLHLDEVNVQVDNTPVSAGLLDLVTCFFHTAHLYREKNLTPKYYVPKTEHYLEARWWNQLFTRLQTSLEFPAGTLRATFLIETLPATFQVEEILYEIRDHAAGLNVGRWDKIFSDIKVLKNHPDRILADRSTINMKKPWMENYAKRIIQICHRRGAFAMGGMSAFTPGKTAQEREEQSQKVLEDKQREASWGHDGCWVSHPYFIGIAMQAFQSQNQLHMTLPDFDKYCDILPQGGGPYTMNGLRTNLRVGIAYIHGWNNNIGCVAFDNLMEDLATLEISRAQIWQWLHHRITLDDGHKVTSELVMQIFNEEREKILREWNDGTNHALLEKALQQATNDAAAIFLKKELPDFLTLTSDKV